MKKRQYNPAFLPNEVNALTLWQPWATLLVDGIKTTETRDWWPPLNALGKPIAIHAGTHKVSKNGIPLAVQERMELGYDADWRDKIPYGAMIGVGILSHYYYVHGRERADKTVMVEQWPNTKDILEGPYSYIPTDPWGDYSVGRYIWQITNMYPLQEPVKIAGKQKIWKWKTQ